MGSIVDGTHHLLSTEAWPVEDPPAPPQGPSRGHLAVKNLMAVITSQDPETHDWSNGALEASCDCLLRITVTHPQECTQKKKQPSGRPRGRPRKVVAEGGGGEGAARKKGQAQEATDRRQGGEQLAVVDTGAFAMDAPRRNKRVRTQKRDPNFVYDSNAPRNAKGNGEDGHESDEGSTESDESVKMLQDSGVFVKSRGGRKRAKVEAKAGAEAGALQGLTSVDSKATAPPEDGKAPSETSNTTKTDGPVGSFVMGWGSGRQQGRKGAGGNAGHRKVTQVRYIRSHQWVLGRASPAVLLPLIAKQLCECGRLQPVENGGGEGEGQLVTVDLDVHDEQELEALSCLVRMLYTGDYGSDAHVATKHKRCPLGAAQQLVVLQVARRFEMKEAVLGTSAALAGKLGPHCVPVAQQCLTTFPYPTATQPDLGEGGFAKLVLRAADVVAESLGPVHELWQGDRSLRPLALVKAGEPHRKPGGTCFDLSLKPSVTSLPLAAFKAVLRSDALQLKSENDTYWLMRAWLDAQPGLYNDTSGGLEGNDGSARGPQLLIQDDAFRLQTYMDLLSCLRLPRMTSSFLALVVARDPYLEASGQGTALLAQALWFRDSGISMLQKSSGWTTKREKIAMGLPSRATLPTVTDLPPLPSPSPAPVATSLGGLEQHWTFVASFERAHADLCERSALGAFQPVGVVAGMPLLIQMQRRRCPKDGPMLGIYAGLKLNPTPSSEKGLEQWGGVCASMTIEANLMPPGPKADDPKRCRVWGPYQVIFHAGDSEGSYWGAPSFFRWDAAWDASANANAMQIELANAGNATPPAPPAPSVQVTINITLPLAPALPALVRPSTAPPTTRHAEQGAAVSVRKAMSEEKDRTPCYYNGLAGGAGAGAVPGAGGGGPETIFTPPNY